MIWRAGAAALAALIVGAASAQMVSGTDMPGFFEAMGVKGKSLASGLKVRQIGSSPSTHVLWPGEALTLHLEFTSEPARARLVKGVVRSVGYRTSVPPGDIWVPHVSKTGLGQEAAFEATLSASGTGRVKVKVPVPSRLGGYGLVLDLGREGAAYLGSVARVVKPSPGMVKEPAYAVDMPWPHEMSEAVMETFHRLGVKGCRMGASYVASDRPSYRESMAYLDQMMAWCRKHGITVMLTIGAGDAPMPLGRGRPWLRPDGTMIEGNKEDLAWLPSQDEDFRRYVAEICTKHGWPKGPVNAVELWNEPWEGVSISGWGADLPRYQELYTKMAQGVMDARAKGAQVLIGGASSSSNTRDKLFSDGSDRFLPWLDFVSVHYEGNLGTGSQDKRWNSRKGPLGRVKVWDTESWVANSEDRIAGVVASMLSFGQDRAMGTYGGNVYHPQVIRVDDQNVGIVNAWSPAAAVAATARYIGQRPFQKLLFNRGLPFVYLFQDPEAPDDGTLVVLGDMTKLYNPSAVALRSAQQALPPGGGLFMVSAPSGAVMLDFAGNPLQAQKGAFRIPLNANGFFLRTNGSKGSFARLVAAVQKGRVQGYAPVVLEAKDFLESPVRRLRVQVTNVLNRTVSGRLSANLMGKDLTSQALSLKPGQSKEAVFEVISLPETPRNIYSARIHFQGQDGSALLEEPLKANVISRRTVKVDGDLSDWKGALPQAILGEGLRRTMTEEAWLPFAQAGAEAGKTLTTGWLAFDERGISFAADITDPSPGPAGVRYATRDDDRYYYPEVSYTTASASSAFAVRWTGEAVAPLSGEYTIKTESDDGVRVWINGSQVISNWTDHGPTVDEGKVTLRQGEKIQVKLEYFQGGGGAVIRLFWKRPDGREETLTGTFKREVFLDRDFGSRMGERNDDRIQWTLGPDLPGVASGESKLAHRWPEGVRRFSYRMDPDLPAGNGTDNVQIAFNVLPQSEKPLTPYPRGTFWKYTAYACTDYEYALNPVGEEWGGGTEIWRLSAPGIPRKHFYPRQPKAPVDGGPVSQGELVIRRTEKGRIVECLIPWSEIPEVEKAMRAGKTVKFSFRVNDNSGPAYELAQGRSVSKENAPAFHNDWTGHWANELEFAFEGAPR